MLKRSAVVVAIAGMLVAMLGILAPASSNAAGASSASASSVVCKLKGARKVVCPTRKLRGPRGPRGLRGATGPQGPAGPAGPPGSGATSVNPFKFLAIGNTPNTTIYTFTGAVAEAGCQGGAFTNERLRGTADNGSAQVVNPRLDTEDFNADLDTGENVDLYLASNDQYGLTYMSAAGVQMASAHYSAHQGAGIGGVFDCAIYGTVSVS
jgi:hypothetical protein